MQKENCRTESGLRPSLSTHAQILLAGGKTSAKNTQRSMSAAHAARAMPPLAAGGAFAVFALDPFFLAREKQCPAGGAAGLKEVMKQLPKPKKLKSESGGQIHVHDDGRGGRGQMCALRALGAVGANC